MTRELQLRTAGERYPRVGLGWGERKPGRGILFKFQKAGAAPVWEEEGKVPRCR